MLLYIQTGIRHNTIMLKRKIYSPKTTALFALFFLFSSALCLANEATPLFFIADSDNSWQAFQLMHDGTGLKQLTSNSTGVHQLSATVDGQHLLITTNNQTNFLLNISTLKKTAVTKELKGIIDATLSKDNKLLLFSLSIAGSNDANHIWLINRKSQKLTQLTHMQNLQHSPIWSSNDDFVFFLSGNGGQSEDIWRLNMESGSLRQLTSGYRYNFDLACSVTDEIAFSSNRSGNYEIWTMDPFGGHIRQLTHDPAMDSQPSWSPDGRQLAFVSTRDGEPALYIMDKEGKNTRRLSPEGLICRNPVWSR